MLDALQQAWNTVLAIPHLGLYLTVGWIGYMVWLGGWIVLQKRDPAATLSWLMGLALLPYVGFAVYYVFGPQKIRRQRQRRLRARAGLRAAVRRVDAEAHELIKLGRAATGLPQTTATKVELLIDGAAKYRALLADVAAAREHIHLEYYIYAPDRTGTALRDALVERARAGVKVRLLLDAVGSGKCRRPFFEPLLDAGGELAWFHPVRWGRFWQIWQRPWLNLRTHRKIVVIDGHIAFTGGMNITDEEDERLREDAYRDLHLRLEGDAVQSLQQVFLEDWAYANGQALQLPASPQAPPGSIPAQVLISGPDSRWEAIHRIHVGAIHAAERRVWLVTPYFVPSAAAMMALTSAALGGVDVRLLVPEKSDSRLVTQAGRSYYDVLLAAGARIYQYGPRLMHSKALLVDDDMAIIGSANFDPRSFHLNFEVSMLFNDANVAAGLARLIEGEFAAAVPVRDDRTRSLWRHRLPEAVARLFSPLL
ncbi:MAG: cardiolipin synthase [Gammaproteobacteria bacterium]|nr:cardiolipin synthase [Gammaproteobacteria bacterium]